MPAPRSRLRPDARRIAATALLASLALSACSRPPPPPEPVRPAIVARADAGGQSRNVFYSGELRARHESRLAFQVGGKVARRLVDAGSRVEPGQVLATLDPDDLRLGLSAAEAAVASARAEAELARSEHDRHAGLLARQLISAALFEAKESALAAAQARLEQAQAQRAVQRNQLAYAQLRADRAGVVTRVDAEVGQVVAPGQVVAVLAQEDELEVEIALPEAQVARLQVGDPAEVSLWSDADQRIAGAIREIAPDADPASRTFRARVRLDDPPAGLALGLTARVRFQQAGRGHLRVPLAALHRDNGDAAVWRLDPEAGTVHLRAVEVAGYDEDGVDIAAGLAATDWLVVAGVHLLHEGQRIRPIDRDNRPIAP